MIDIWCLGTVCTVDGNVDVNVDVDVVSLCCTIEMHIVLLDIMQACSQYNEIH